MNKNNAAGLILFLLSFFCLATFSLSAQSSKLVRELYMLEVYHFQTAVQGERINQYLEKAFLPAMHRQNFKFVGVFENLSNDTASQKTIYVLIPFSSFDEMMNLSPRLNRDQAYLRDGASFLNTPYDQPNYDRVEKILMQAFPLATKMTLPKLSAPKNERVYELRSYESPTQKLYVNKVEMFNEGGEIALFKRLNFNAVFYASVISGSRMPNLMYMTSFENMTERDAHWKEFVDAPEWKKLTSNHYYDHNVSKADIFLLRPASYSDY